MNTCRHAVPRGRRHSLPILGAGTRRRTAAAASQKANYKQTHEQDVSNSFALHPTSSSNLTQHILQHKELPC